MPEEQPLIESLSRTGGLISSQQLIDTTSNEFFSLRDSTSKEESVVFFYAPYEVTWLEPQEGAEDALKEFKSIVKNKLKKPLDLKKLYYEQLEHGLL